MIEILKFTSPTCAPCKMLNKQLENYTKNKLTTVDFTDDPDELFEKHNVKRVPTLVVLYNGSPAGKQVGGSMTLDSFTKWVDDIENVVKEYGKVDI